jgi:hypothetical protein
VGALWVVFVGRWGWRWEEDGDGVGEAESFAGP